MQLHKNQDGFTLVEVTVVILISAIILLFSSGMVLSANNLFVANKNRSEDKQIGDAVFSYISEELTYGNYVMIFPDEDSSLGEVSTSRTLTVTDGKLYVQGSDVFGDTFYLGRTIQFTAQVYSTFHIVLSVSVLDKDGAEVYNTSTTIKVLNMALKGMSIEDTAGGSINPYITYDLQGS